MISDPSEQSKLINTFAFLSNAPDEFHRVFFNNVNRVNFPSGMVIAEPGSECSQLALVVDGSVRVYKLGAQGREVTLYRVTNGDSCVLSAASLMSCISFPATAISETKIDALVIPTSVARVWVDQYQAWNQFVLGLISQRLSEVITVLDNVAFQRMDVRIAAYLVKHADDQLTQMTTHANIAAELGSSREVISRELKSFSNRGWVTLGRGTIVINDTEALSIIASGVRT